MDGMRCLTNNAMDGMDVQMDRGERGRGEGGTDLSTRGMRPICLCHRGLFLIQTLPMNT